MKITDIYREYHPKAEEQTFFSYSMEHSPKYVTF
jgi:hypothetical protein